MVELEEVEDAELDRPQPGPINEDDEDSADFTDTDSSISTSSLPPQNTFDETLSERLLALRDMIPPSTRRRISNTSSKIARVITSGALWSGKGIYVLSTSLLMVGIPWALAYLDEQQVLELEREQKARDSAGEVVTPGASTSQLGQQGRPAL